MRKYGAFIATMNVLELINWAVGISLPNEKGRPWVFLVSFEYGPGGK